MARPLQLVGREGFAFHNLHVPGVSVAVIHAGKLEWARGFGVTRIGGPAVASATVFQAASISKPVTTLAVLQWVHSGKLNLDTDINQYLTSWKLPDNKFTQQSTVTLRKLLTHSAGVTVHGFAGYATDAPLPTLVQILNGDCPPTTSLSGWTFYPVPNRGIPAADSRSSNRL